VREVSKDVEEGLKGRWFREVKDDPFSGGYFEVHKDRAVPAKTKDLTQKFGDAFRYQYVKIGKDGLWPQNLLEAIVADLKFAKKICEEQ
jgi:hypothetical protein